MSDEEIVRSFWERVIVCDGSYRGYPRDTILINYANHQFYDFDSWSDAAIFTRARKDRIRERKEEIEFMVDGSYPASAGKVRHRIILTLESLLRELLIGVRWHES